MGLIDPDEFWFSPRFGSLPAVLAAEAARGTVGVGQNAFIYGFGGGVFCGFVPSRRMLT